VSYHKCLCKHFASGNITGVRPRHMTMAVDRQDNRNNLSKLFMASNYVTEWPMLNVLR
jgi:hypothetical protein